ncbi:MAG: GTP cyclohydrolase, FolE2/MptA family [Acidilobus sp.]
MPVKRIGFRGVLKRILIKSPQGLFAFDAKINVYVDLSSNRKGAHLSRNVDAMQILDSFPQESWSLEGLAESIHDQLLNLHGYSDSAGVELYTTYWARAAFEDIESLEPVRVKVAVVGGRSEKTFLTSVSVKGFTVCPSAQRTIADMFNYSSTAPSHSQKVMLRGSVISRKLHIISIDDIASALWASLSAPAFTLLKRPQEARLVFGAHRNPRFAEDAVREAVRRLRCLVDENLPKDTVLKAEIYSLESIHPHNVFAVAEGKVEELPKIGCGD